MTRSPRGARMGAFHETIAASEQEQREVAAVARLLRRGQSHGTRRPRLVGAGDEAVELPESVVRVLRDVTDRLARGDGVAIVPVERELTTQQAADLLNVSRPYLVGLLDRSEIPCVRTRGAHRRVRLADLLAYKASRDAERAGALDRLVELSEDLGLYERD